MPLRVLLAEDHVIVRQGLNALLKQEGFDVVAEAADGQEAVRLARKLQPDICVLDLAMPFINGLTAATEILKACPRSKLIVLTMFSEDHYVLAALRAGAKGYVLKSNASEDLVQAIHEVSRGRAYLSPDISRTVVEAYVTKREVAQDPLSSRERQVLQLVAEGKTTKEIAQLLEISVKTAESHRTRIMEKLDIHDTAGLVRYAIRRGLIQP